MLFSKYYILLSLPTGISFFRLTSKGKLNNALLKSLLSVQDCDAITFEQYLANGMTLEITPGRKRALSSPFSKVFFVVPDSGLRFIESRLPLTDSHQVKNLAALALASEVNHLAPELVCYRYLVKSQENSDWLIQVTSAPKSIYDHIALLLPKASRFQGLLSSSDCLSLFEVGNKADKKSQLNQLPSLCIKPREKQGLQGKSHVRTWLFIICFAFLSQLLLLYSYESEKQEHARMAMALSQSQAKSIKLATFKINQSALLARELIQSLPLDVRVNSIVNEADSAWLGLSVSQARLLSLLPSWQDKWRDFEFLLLDEWLQPISVILEQTQIPMIRTRSVLHVVIQIQKK